MEIQKSDIVCSLAGRDKGQLFYVFDTVDGKALIADGKGRKLDRLKRKNPKHLRIVAAPGDATAARILCGEKVTDSELRRAIRGLRGEPYGE